MAFKLRTIPSLSELIFCRAVLYSPTSVPLAVRISLMVGLIAANLSFLRDSRTVLITVLKSNSAATALMNLN